MTTSQELATIEQAEVAPNLFGVSDPALIVAKATNVARALADVIKARRLAVGISGREYVRCEGWTLLGTMLGVFPVCVWTRPLEDGYEARVEARTLGGQIVGAAEAMCTRSESKWSKRDDYALRSMAQTRATAKALRLPLGFVMSLAGYDPTPAEEIPDEERQQRGAAGGQRTGKSPDSGQANSPASPLASEAQIKTIRRNAEKAGIRVEMLCELYSVSRLEEMTVDMANDALRHIADNEAKAS